MKTNPTRQRGSAVGDLLIRYKTIFQLAWKDRAQTDAQPYSAAEAQFLPAVLAVQETPVPAAPRVFMWLVIAFSVIAVTWSALGKVDIIAVAQGKLIPSDFSKLVQSLGPAVVTVVHVKDGQSVKAGDLLVELDSKTESADIERARADIESAALQAARSSALLDAMSQHKAPTLPAVPDTSAEQRREAKRVLDGQYGEYVAKLARTEAETATREAELRASKELVRKLEATLPLAQQRSTDMALLAKDGFVSEHTYLERKQAYLEQTGELATQRERLHQLGALINESRRQADAYKAEVRRATLDLLKEAQQRGAAVAQDLLKAESRGKLTRLLAPVDGTVQQLIVHTVGGVVTPAQQLMVIVPAKHPLEVEAMLQNKDVGFVRDGQEVTLKLDAFPFTTYGVIRGKVSHVSRDAIPDEKRGLHYSVRVQMERSFIKVDGADVQLGPGMAASVEIKTGQRRVISFFLNPLLQTTQESLHER